MVPQNMFQLGQTKSVSLVALYELAGLNKPGKHDLLARMAGLPVHDKNFSMRPAVLSKLM
jgi:hypothetical protein